MRTNLLRKALQKAVFAGASLLFAAGVSSAQQQVNLTAQRTSTLLPDGKTVPMWGYTCGAAVTTSTATCASVNKNLVGWAPPVITIPTGQGLTIALTNNLPIPTSLVIVGQLGGSLGSPVREATPRNHPTQVGTTWPAAGGTATFTPPAQIARAESFVPEAAALTGTQSYTWNTGSLKPGTYLIMSGTHPSIQGPMGLYGVLVVTQAPVTGVTPAAGVAYPANATAVPPVPVVQYDSDAVVLLSEIDPVQNAAVDLAVATPGFSETALWTRSGSTGPVTALSLTGGGSGYPTAPAVTISGGTGKNAAATTTLVFGVGSITPIAPGSGYATTDTVNITGGGGTGAIASISAVDTTGGITSITVTNPGSGYTSAPAISFTRTGTATGTLATASSTLTSTGSVSAITLTNAGDGYSSPLTVTIAPPPSGVQASAAGTVTMGGCGGGAHTCYPPAVDYSPMYYLINGQSFSKTAPGQSTIQLPTAASTGNVLVRFVNASPRMHTPAVVGLPMTLIAEDGNQLPGTPRIQNEVFLSAGKVYDVIVKPPQVAGSYTAAAYPVFDRALSLSTNNQRDGGMIAYLEMGAATAGSAGGPPAAVTPQAVADFYKLPPNRSTFSSNVLSNDIGITGATLVTAPAAGTLVFNSDGSFIYTSAPNTFITTVTFSYSGNVGATTYNTVTVTLSVGPAGVAPTAVADAYPTTDYPVNVAGNLKVSRPGVLGNDTDPSGYPLTAVLDPCVPPAGGTCLTASQLTLNNDGSFLVSGAAAGTYGFNYHAVNSQGTPSNSVGVTLTFPVGNGPTLTVKDPQSGTILTDYKWVIEEDTTIHHAGNGITTPPPQQTLATSFHRSYMPVVASGCTGTVSCSSGQMVLDTTVGSPTYGTHIAVPSLPVTMTEQVHLDPTKYYYVSILPGDAADAFIHGGGAAQAIGGTITNLSEVGTTVIALTGSDPGLTVGQTVTVTGATAANAGYNGTFFVTADTATGFTYTAFTSGLTADTGAWTSTRAFNPNSTTATVNPGDCVVAAGAGNCGHTMGGSPILSPAASGSTTFAPVTVLTEPNPVQPAQLSIFVYEDNNPTNGDVDGVEEQQGLGGFQIILNDVAGGTGITIGQMTYDVFNMPLTNALVGTKDTATGLDACPNTPAVGTTKPGSSPANNLVGMVITCPNLESDGKTPSPLAGKALIKNLFPDRFDVLVKAGAEREAAGEQWIQTSTLEGTHANDGFAKLGEPAYFQEFGPPGFHAFVGFVNPAHVQQVNASLHGTHKIAGKVTNLHMSRPVDESLHDSASHVALSQTVCFVGLNSQNGVGANIAFAQCAIDPISGDASFTLTGIPDGQYEIVVWDQWQDQILQYQTVTVSGADVNVGDVPAFSWFQTLETRTFIDNGTDNPGIAQVPMTIRFRDGSIAASTLTDFDGNAVFNELFPLFNWYVMESDTTRFKGTQVSIVNDAGGAVDTAGPYAGLLNSTESFSLPANRRVPGAIYDPGKTTRRDPGTTLTEGFQAFISQPQIVNWGKTLYTKGENGGILGHVVYGSTRPFDDPTQLFQNLWEPLVPHVTINLYKEAVAPDGTQSLQFIDTTTTSSWDDWANGTNAAGMPNMNCPGQDTADPYYVYTLGSANQYKCYDGFHNWNQVEPAPYDGGYQFPTAKCTICVSNPASTPANPLPNILPAGTYVAEVVVPPGMELVKEEDKNILIGDAFIAPITQQFGGLSNIFILPDQASINAFNPNNTSNPTTDLGRTSIGGFGPGLLKPPSACVGAIRVVPEFMSIAPQSGQVAPFAGASRPLCDRKEITLEDQTVGKADFFVFTPTPRAAHFTGIILDDLSSEFNTTSPDFGEKFSVPFIPVSFRDFNGVEVSRTYADQFGTFNGLIYSNWMVNAPNPAGYAPNMMITCMNDPGPIPDPLHPGQMIVDPQYNPQYSNFCYTNAYMPGLTDYMDTPVLPVAAFAAGYNPVDCAYPDATPAILRVDGDAPFGPYLSATGSRRLTITALGDVAVPNNAYNGPGSVVNGVPTASSGLGGQATIIRHYGFGNPQGNNQGNGQCPGTVTLNGNPLTINSWSDTSITATVPAGATTGELVITACNGKKSVDTVTVTVGGKAPIYVTPPPQTGAISTGLYHPIQDAIDAALPGDMIMLNGAVTPNTPGGTCPTAFPYTGCTTSTATYSELVIMWKPVQLQGVGAASVIINAAKYPTQKLQDWRTKINGLFGLDAQGNAVPGPTQVDVLPGQEITGGVVALEPSVLSTEEGAGITVLAKNLPAVNNVNQCGAPGSATGPNVSNFLCGNARIDGVSITGGDAGGGIYVNGWAHNLEISNNRVYGNAGTFTGGIRVGQPYLEGQTGGGPFGYDQNVKVHHNSITENGTLESNLGTGAGGGLSMCSGTDNYLVNFNFICGNISLGDGGGMGHLGVSWKGQILNNQFLFNQSFNQSSTTSGGGLAIEGETGTGTTLSLGTGDLIVDSNLFLGNQASGGHGGGVRMQDVNGDDVNRNPDLPGTWWRVGFTNNMVVDNIAGWSGGGISLENTVNSYIVNNTIASNDSTATAGPVFTTSHTTSTPQPAGISSELNSPTLVAAFGASVPDSLEHFSNPFLENNIIWQNRSFYFTVTSGAGSGANPGTPATSTLMPILVQTTAGQCASGANYWDLGVLGQPQTSPAMKLNPTFSILTSIAGYNATSAHNSASNPMLVHQYCNGARGNPGIPDSGPPNGPFTLQASATEDEGGNFVDVRFGPLSLSDSSIPRTGLGFGTPLGDYRITTGSPAKDTANSELAPNHDFFGTPRPQGPDFDRGAHEVVQNGGVLEGELTVSPTLVGFGSVQIGTVATLTTTITNNGRANLAFTVGQLTGANPNQFTRVNNCGGNLAAGASCTITLIFHPTNSAGGVGPKTAAFNVTETDPNNPLNVPVTVTLTGEGQRPSGTVLPTPLAFGSQLVNTITLTAAQPVTVTNTGVGPLFIASIILNGGNANQFTQTNVNCPIGGLGIPVGGTCTINVNFQPTSLTPANKIANLAVRFTNPLTLPFQVQNVTLTGTATAVTVTQVPLAFGTAPPANTTLTAQVNNNAASGNLTITSVTITTGGAWFTIAAGTTCTPGAVVAATNSCDVNVTFTRTPANSTANRTGNLRIVTQSGTFNVPLSGN